MDNEELPQSFESVDRRGFLGGVASLLAAAAFTREVPDEVSAQVAGGDDSATQTVASPDGTLGVTVDMSDGIPTYSVASDGTTYVEPSAVGFDFQNQSSFGRRADGSTGAPVSVTGSEYREVRETWTPVWDQFDEIPDEYNELRVGLREDSGAERAGTLEVRVYDDGFGFRFVFSEDFSDGESFVVASENTEFAFAGDYRSWWIDNEFVNPRFEQEYAESPLSGLPSGTETRRPNDNEVRNGVHTPLTMEADDGTYLSVHEADLTDYATMSLAPQSSGSTTLSAELAPLPDGTAVAASVPHVTPWRTIQVGDRPGDLVESSLVPLLNDELDASVFPTDASGDPDLSWITPQKFTGIWWLMIAGSANWEYKTDQEVRDDGGDPRQYIHGAQTERMKRYMAFSSEHGIESVLAEGWNQGWDTYPGDGTGLEFVASASYPDFDVAEVTDFGQARDPPVEMTMHNETAGNVVNYEDSIETEDPFGSYEDNDIRSIKNGYVADAGLGFEGDGSTASHNHHCQLAVNHHELVAREAAENRQMLEMHEAVKPTGRRRTYPNLTTREVIKGQEYDGFSDLTATVTPGHHVTIPFTRYLGGPADYTPGIFDTDFTDNNPGRIETTRAKQLAMSPTYFSGLQMVADRMEAYVDETLEVGELVQAPSADIDGFVTADTWRNAYGAHYVAVDPNRVDAGSTISWTVKNVDAADEYDLHFRYASSGTENTQTVIDEGTQATLKVNGEPYDGGAGKIGPAFTDDWDQWEVFTQTVSLEAGDNTVTLELQVDDQGGFNLNTLAVTEVGGSFPSTPENENFDAKTEFEFIENVPAAWDDTRVVDAEIGDYAVTARRSGDEWFVGAMSDEGGRAVDVPMDFLSPGVTNSNERANGNGGGNSSGPKYVAELYSDGIGGGYQSNPETVRVDEAVVTPDSTVLASMARSGGTAIRLRRARGQEINDLPEYERPDQEFTVDIGTGAALNEPFITATGSNDGDFVGGKTVEILVDGELETVDNVRIPPNSENYTFEFGFRFTALGTYDVIVRDPESGAVLASETVDARPGELVASFSDPQGDDYGPGTYEYPTNGAFQEGAFDLREFSVYESDSAYLFAFQVGNLYDAFGGSFSPHYFVVYLSDPSLDGGRTTELGDLQVTAEFGSPWDYRVAASGFGTSVVNDDGTRVGAPGVLVDFDANTAILSVDKRALDDIDLGSVSVAPVVGSEDFGSFRAVKAGEPGDFRFGGAKADATGNATRIIDLLTPDGVAQEDTLDYDSSTLATVPFTSLQ